MCSVLFNGYRSFKQVCPTMSSDHSSSIVVASHVSLQAWCQAMPGTKTHSHGLGLSESVCVPETTMCCLVTVPVKGQVLANREISLWESALFSVGLCLWGCLVAKWIKR